MPEESYTNILVIQTAFIGDAILTLPLLQALKTVIRNPRLTSLSFPGLLNYLQIILLISKIIPYDKRGNDRGLKGLWRLRNISCCTEL